MINPTGKKLEKLLFGMFDDAIQGVDRYNHNGCLWLIFTDEMRWVVEYTKTQTLWYNYYFFKNEMEMVGLDCVEDKDLIQKWFESRYLNINQVKHTLEISNHRMRDDVEDTIQNGVKNTVYSDIHSAVVKDTIQNGVKEIYEITYQFIERVEDTIKSGVKKILSGDDDYDYPVRDTIQNGVKETCKSESTKSISLRRAIQNGVKHCEDGDWLDGDKRFEDIIQNGEKK